MSNANTNTVFASIVATRDSLHPGFERLDGLNGCCAVYLGAVNGQPVARGFVGRSLKCDFGLRFTSEAHRADYVDAFMRRHNEAEARRMAEKEAPCGLEVGDVLRSVWGYEQTNVDYYLVVQRSGKKTVKIVEIGKSVIHDGDMNGRCAPDPSKEVGVPLSRRVQGNGVRISSYAVAHKVVPRIDKGIKTFPYDSWTSYA